MIAEAHALDDLAVADVEAGDDAFGKNGRNSSGAISSSSSALPLIAAATAAWRRARARSARRAHAAGSLPVQSAESAARLPRTASRLGPVSAPSRSMSVHSTCLRPTRMKRLDALPTA